MTGKNKSLKFKQEINLPVPEVYNCFVHASAYCEWLCSVAQVDGVKGGRIYLWWESGYFTSGEFIELLPNEKIVFSWHGRGEAGTSRVRVTFKPIQQGTLLILQHDEISQDKAWKQIRREYKKGWSSGLENLKSVLETGEDLRLVRKPMIGISSLKELDEKLAAELGCPARAGLLVEGILEGMPSDRASLHPGDFLVKVGGKKVTSISSLSGVLNQHRAGDQVKLVFYRQGEKMNGKVELVQRAIPEIPASSESLAKNLESHYDQFHVELGGIVEKKSEGQMDWRKTPESWNVKENLAHLIVVERDIQTWVERMIEGQQADLSFHSNQPVRMRALLMTLPKLKSLIAELKRDQSETVNIVKELPDEFVRRRGSFWRLGYELLRLSLYHLPDHLKNIKELVESAPAGEVISQNAEEDSLFPAIPNHAAERNWFEL